MNCQLWKFPFNYCDLNWTFHIILSIYLRRFPLFFFLFLILLEECKSFSPLGRTPNHGFIWWKKNGGMNLKISFIHPIFPLVFSQAAWFLQKTSWACFFGFISKYTLYKWSAPSVTETSVLSVFCQWEMLPSELKISATTECCPRAFQHIETVFWSYKCKTVLDYFSFLNSWVFYPLFCARTTIFTLIQCSKTCLVLQAQSILDQNLQRCFGESSRKTTINGSELVASQLLTCPQRL